MKPTSAGFYGYVPWSDKEIDRAIKRIALFERRGLSADLAEQLADRLATRDRDLDERRCCIECSHRKPNRDCDLGLPVSLHRLVRCPGFGWAVP